MSPCPVFPPETTPCSEGRGSCVGPDACACPYPWTGEGDFVRGSQSCDLHVEAIRGVWCVAAVFLTGQALGGVYLLRHAASRVRQKLASGAGRRKESLSWGELARLYLDTSTFMPGVGAILAGGFLGTLAINRAAHPYEGIGVNVLSSVVFFLGTVAYWIMGSTFIFAYFTVATSGIKMAHNSQRVAQRAQFLKRVCLPIVWITAAVGGAASLPMLADPAHMSAYATLHYASIALTCLVFCGIIIPMLTHPMLAELDSTIAIFTNQSGVDVAVLVQVRKKIAWMRSQVIFNGMLQCLLCAVLAAWPYLQRKSSYFHAVAWVQGGLTGMVVAWASLPSHDKKSSTNMGSGGGGSSGARGAAVDPATGTATGTAGSSSYFNRTNANHPHNNASASGRFSPSSLSPSVAHQSSVGG